MATTPRRKQGNFGTLEVVPGGQYAQRRNRGRAAMGFTTTEFNLDRDMRTLFAALEGEDGTVPSRSIQAVREGERHPWRMMARRFREARRANVPPAKLHEIAHRMTQYIAALYGEPGITKRLA